MSDFLLLGGITNAVNVPSLSAEEAPRLKPYMALAEKLGALVGQIAGNEIRSIDVEVEGAAAELNIKPITGAVLAGLMGTWSDTVNMVNAPYPREGARARRARDPQRARGRLSHARRGHGRDRRTGRGASRHLVRQPRAAAGRTSSGFRSRPSWPAR